MRVYHCGTAAVLAAIIFPQVSAHAASFSFTEIGNLGGTSEPSVRGMNASGQVTGYAYTPDFVAHGFLYTPGAGMQVFTLAPTSNIIPTGINNAGIVVGYGASGNALSNISFIYSAANGLQKLNNPAGSSLNIESKGINSSGEIVGYLQTSPGSTGFTYTAAGGIQLVHPLANYSSGGSVEAVNNNGQITGVASNSAGTFHSYLLTPGQNAIDLGTIGTGLNTTARQINASGQVAGLADFDTHGITHLFLYTPGSGMHDLGLAAGASIASVLEMNDAGMIVGDNVNGRGFFYSATTGIRDITYPGGGGSEANAVNSFGEVVGNSYIPGQSDMRAIMYTVNGGTVNLNTLIDPSLGWTLLNATAVNDAGQIAGVGLNPAGNYSLFLLTPTSIPEPTSLLILGVGAGALLGRQMRPGARR